MSLRGMVEDVALQLEEGVSRQHGHGQVHNANWFSYSSPILIRSPHPHQVAKSRAIQPITYIAFLIHSVQPTET